MKALLLVFAATLVTVAFGANSVHAAFSNSQLPPITTERVELPDGNFVAGTESVRMEGICGDSRSCSFLVVTNAAEDIVKTIKFNPPEYVGGPHEEAQFKTLLVIGSRLRTIRKSAYFDDNCFVTEFNLPNFAVISNEPCMGPSPKSSSETSIDATPRRWILYSNSMYLEWRGTCRVETDQALQESMRAFEEDTIRNCVIKDLPRVQEANGRVLPKGDCRITSPVRFTLQYSSKYDGLYGRKAVQNPDGSYNCIGSLMVGYEAAP